ncbi:hypothetical protein QAD02_021087 [Eretmocerus hayati]|uniref:Uncharacterized protein n=1 Tax=Eretmocerus hayati TaxID=131215 RepID=A0ACC2PRR6_9HYME|nr:hypothetical protein QAD02_021087 [Eretmocerus hayati]
MSDDEDLPSYDDESKEEIVSFSPMAHLRGWILVRFTHEGPRKKVEEIDMVPFGWSDLDKDKWIIKYIESVEAEEDVDLLHQLVEKRIEAPESWPTFPVEIIGRAKTHAGGIQKLKKLRKVESVLTSDEERTAIQVGKKLRNGVKRFKSLEESVELRQDSVPRKICKSDPKRSSDRVLKSLDLNGSAKKNKSSLGESSSDGSKASGSRFMSQTIPNQYPPSQNTLSVETDEDNQKADLIEFELNVILRLDQIGKNQLLQLQDIKLMQEKQDETNKMLAKLLDSNSKLDVDCFEDKYELDIPFKTLGEFLTFNHDLVKENLMRRDMCESFKSYLDTDLSFSRTMVKIMEKFLSKAVVSEFTAGRSARDGEKELIFFDLQFCKCMCGFLKTKRERKFEEEVGEQELKDALSEVFTNVKK